MKLFVFFVYAPLSHVSSGNTMIFGNRKGKPEKKCRKIGSGEFECDVKRKEKALLAIPKNYQSANEPSLLITETGIFSFTRHLRLTIVIRDAYAYIIKSV